MVPLVLVVDKSFSGFELILVRPTIPGYTDLKGGCAMQMLALWSIFTFLLFLNALALNVALSSLFFMLTITFALLAGGEKSLGSEKVTYLGLRICKCIFSLF